MVSWIPGASFSVSKPHTVMRPSLVISSAASSRISVVLPAPSGPTRPVTWPALIEVVR